MHGSGGLGLGLADAGMEIWAGMALLGLLGFILTYNLTRVINIVGVENLMEAIKA